MNLYVLHKKHISNKHLCLGAAILAAAFVFTMPDVHAKAAERTEDGLVPVYKVKGRTVTWNRNADGYRLLTEAEWEYAARAGKKGIFYTGSQISSDEANYYGYYPYLIEENYENNTNPDVVEGDYRGTTVKVSSFAPNAYGLYNKKGHQE